MASIDTVNVGGTSYEVEDAVSRAFVNGVEFGSVQISLAASSVTEQKVQLSTPQANSNYLVFLQIWSSFASSNSAANIDVHVKSGSRAADSFTVLASNNLSQSSAITVGYLVVPVQ